jgi:hypothetical protein
VKVWVVIGEWDYAGYAEPCGVFDCPDKAYEARKDVLASERRFDRVDVISYELNQLSD